MGIYFQKIWMESIKKTNDHASLIAIPSTSREIHVRRRG